MELKQEKIQLNHIETVVELHVIFQDYKKINTWLKTENLNFGGASPIYLIINGKGHKVLEFIKGARYPSEIE